MPNYCRCALQMKGKKENIRSLIDWMKADYCYEKEAMCYLKEDEQTLISMPHHFYRVFNVDESTMEKAEDGLFTCEVSVICAWSFQTCFMAGEHTYYSENHETHLSNYGLDYAITINDACKELSLEVEGYSYEDGMEFAEHIHVNSDGQMDCYQCEYCHEYVPEDYDTQGEFEEALKMANINPEGETELYMDSPLAKNGKFVYEHFRGFAVC